MRGATGIWRDIVLLVFPTLSNEICHQSPQYIYQTSSISTSIPLFPSPHHLPLLPFKSDPAAPPPPLFPNIVVFPHAMSSMISFSPSWFSHNLFLAAASIAFTYILIRAFYNLFLSPISAIPGPWYAALSDFWMTTHVLRLRKCKVVQELFEIYGPVVRIGPNKVVFKDVSMMRSVYTVHKFDKSSYYKGLLTYVFLVYCLYDR